MGEAARRADATIVISPHQHGEAVRLLGLDPATVHCSPTASTSSASPCGERTSTSGGRAGSTGSRATRRAGTRRAGRRAASAMPRTRCRRVLRCGTGEPRPVLMFVGRFLGFKRVPLLVRAYARARARMSVPAPLVIWGGAPGEWEGEHPHSVADARGCQRRLLRRLARPRRPSARPRLRGLLRRAVHGRAVRPRLPRGDGLRAARDRHAQRRPAELRQRRPRRAGRLARAARRRGRPRRRDGARDRRSRRAHPARRERRPARSRQLLLGRPRGPLHRAVRERRGRPGPGDVRDRCRKRASAACRARGSRRARPRHRSTPATGRSSASLRRCFRGCPPRRRQAAGGKGGPVAVQRQYDAARDLQEALVAAGCRRVRRARRSPRRSGTTPGRRSPRPRASTGCGRRRSRARDVPARVRSRASSA